MRKIILTGVLLALVLLLVFIQKQTLQLDIRHLKEFIRSFGALGPIVFITLNIISIVFSPLTSFPFWVASLALFGFLPTCFYIMVGNSAGSIINFLIAKRFGRPLVANLVGKKGIEKIDEITEMVGLKTLFLARLVGGAATDYVSYAAGLTSMKFKQYTLISIFVTIPMILLNVYLLNRALAFKPIYILILGAWGYILAIIFPLLVYKKKKDRK